MTNSITAVGIIIFNSSENIEIDFFNFVYRQYYTINGMWVSNYNYSHVNDTNDPRDIIYLNSYNRFNIIYEKKNYVNYRKMSKSKKFGKFKTYSMEITKRERHFRFRHKD